MGIEEKIQKQVAAGFTEGDIRSNLVADGNSKEEIDAAFRVQAGNLRNAKQPNPRGIAFGVIMIIVIILRVARFSNSHSAAPGLAIISIVSGIVVVILYFARRR